MTGENTEVASSVKDLNKSDDRGGKTADNIRYGQNISESGMGGMTEGNSGSASTGGECLNRNLVVVDGIATDPGLC